MIVYLNRDFVDEAEARISVWDGGFLYGDGVYTTLRLYRGKPVDLEAHCRRLHAHARELEIPLTHTEKDFALIAARLAAENRLTDRDGRLRITVSRGGGPEHPLPVTGLASIDPTVLVTLAPLGMELERWRTEGIGVITLDAAYARGNFPELKTLNSLATVRALRRAAAAGCPEALLTDAAGRLLEGAVSNLFLVAGGNLLTPDNCGDFLAGRTRQRILSLARGEGIEVREKILDRRHLEAACEVFVASSVREVLPVVRVDDRPVADGKPGPVTLLIQERYREDILAELNRT